MKLMLPWLLWFNILLEVLAIEIRQEKEVKGIQFRKEEVKQSYFADDICRKLKESESEVAQLYLTLSNPMDCSLPRSSIHGIFQARILEWVAISFSRGSSQPRDWTPVSCIVDRRFTIWATRAVQLHWSRLQKSHVRLPFTFYVDPYMDTLPLQAESWFFYQEKGNKFLVSANSLGSHLFSWPGNATCPVFQ